MDFSVEQPPKQKQVIQNMTQKLQHPDFTGDLTAIIRPMKTYDQDTAYTLIQEALIEKI